MSTLPSTKKVSPVVYFIGLTAALAGLLFGLDVGPSPRTGVGLVKCFNINKLAGFK
jgi:hypothetical protein